MNNSATTRKISKIAFEYQGDDKGLSELVFSQNLLGETPEMQFEEMKAVAERNSNVEKWALTGYISLPVEEKMSDEDLKNLCLEALKKIGMANSNQAIIHQHNSTKQRHLHFLCNRISIDGICTVKSHNIGKRFGEAVREISRQKGYETDVEIGIKKRSEMLANLTESIAFSSDFKNLIDLMKQKGFIVELSENVKDGISGMRITMEKDKNYQTERVYKSGYKLSQISNKLNIREIKDIFRVKQEIRNTIAHSRNVSELKKNLLQKNISAKINYSKDLNGNLTNRIEKLLLKPLDSEMKKNGFFFNEYDGYSISEIDNVFSNDNLNRIFDSINNTNTYNSEENLIQQSEKDSLLDILLKSDYAPAESEENRRKKRRNNGYISY